MNYQEKFKQKFIGSTFKLAFTNWFKITLAYFIVFILTAGVFLMILSSIMGGFNPLVWTTAKSGLLGISSIPMGLFTSILQLVSILSISVIISLLIASWYYNFSFVAVSLKVKGIRAGFGKVFIKSFNSGIFKILLINLIYFVFTFVVLIAVLYSTRFSFWIIIPVSLLYVFLIFKTILVMPSYVIGKKSFAESFKFSFKHVTILRILKILLAVIVVAAVLFGISLLLSLLPGLRPTEIYEIIILIATQQLFQIIVYGFLGSLFISGISGLYYRYKGDTAITELKKDKVIDEVQGTNSKNDDDDEPYDMSKNLFA